VKQIRLLESQIASVPKDWIDSHTGSPGFREFAKQLAAALAFLEDDLRRTDPVGESIRWLAAVCTRDILSFPERVSPPLRLV
jgi:hypothetical protein